MSHGTEFVARSAEYDEFKPLELLTEDDFETASLGERSRSAGYDMRDYWFAGRIGDQEVSERDIAERLDYTEVNYLRDVSQDYTNAENALRPALVRHEHEKVMEHLGETLHVIKNISVFEDDIDDLTDALASLRGLAVNRMYRDSESLSEDLNTSLRDEGSVEAWIFASLPNGKRIGARCVEFRMSVRPGDTPVIEPVVLDRTGTKRGLLPDGAVLVDSPLLFFSADEEN